MSRIQWVVQPFPVHPRPLTRGTHSIGTQRSKIVVAKSPHFVATSARASAGRPNERRSRSKVADSRRITGFIKNRDRRYIHVGSCDRKRKQLINLIGRVCECLVVVSKRTISFKYSDKQNTSLFTKDGI